MPIWDADSLRERSVYPKLAEALGFFCRRLTAAIAFRSTLLTPLGRPLFLSSRPASPSSIQLLKVL